MIHLRQSQRRVSEILRRVLRSMKASGSPGDGSHKGQLAGFPRSNRAHKIPLGVFLRWKPGVRDRPLVPIGLGFQILTFLVYKCRCRWIDAQPKVGHRTGNWRGFDRQHGKQSKATTRSDLDNVLAWRLSRSSRKVPSARCFQVPFRWGCDRLPLLAAERSGCWSLAWGSMGFGRGYVPMTAR